MAGWLPPSSAIGRLRRIGRIETRFFTLLSRISKKEPRRFIFEIGRAAQNRTEIKDFGDPYTNHCTTTL